MFDSIGGGEIILIMLAILLLFGPKRIPDLAQSLGKGLREFRKAQQELQSNLTKVVNSEDMSKITGTFRDMTKDVQESVQKLNQHLMTAPAANPSPARGPAEPTPAVPSTDEPPPRPSNPS